MPRKWVEPSKLWCLRMLCNSATHYLWTIQRLKCQISMEAKYLKYSYSYHACFIILMHRIVQLSLYRANILPNIQSQMESLLRNLLDADLLPTETHDWLDENLTSTIGVKPKPLQKSALIENEEGGSPQVSFLQAIFDLLDALEKVPAEIGDEAPAEWVTAVHECDNSIIRLLTHRGWVTWTFFSYDIQRQTMQIFNIFFDDSMAASTICLIRLNGYFWKKLLIEWRLKSLVRWWHLWWRSVLAG